MVSKIIKNDNDDSRNVVHSPGVMNFLFFLFVAGGVLTAAGSGGMKEISEQSFESAKSAVQLAISLIGIMAFWLGMMKILESAGVVRGLARVIAPFLGFLFRDVPKGHPAMGAMVLNVSANMFGLGNAATPFGIRAMEELQKINPKKEMASHAMCLFLAINTSSVALLPLGVIGVRAAAGAADPAGIWIPTMVATLASTCAGVIACLIFRSRSAEVHSVDEVEISGEVVEDGPPDTKFHFTPSPAIRIISLSVIAGILLLSVSGLFSSEGPLEFIKNEFSSFWFMPLLMLLIVAYGMFKGVRVYDAAVEGAKDGFTVAVRIIPFLVVILVAIGVFRSSGALGYIASFISPLTMFFGLPAEVLPMAILRPLSGSGAFAVMSEMISRDPDSYESFVASVLMGSTETTFYVVTVYFGAVGIMKFRYAILCGLIADFAGILSGSLISRWWFF
jgi:spore maturation protein SpmA